MACLATCQILILSLRYDIVVHTDIQYRRSLLDFLIISQELTKESKETECLLCHGDDDTLVYHRWGMRSYETIAQAGIKANFISYPGTPPFRVDLHLRLQGLEHAANEEEISDVLAFIQKVLKPLGKL